MVLAKAYFELPQEDTRIVSILPDMAACMLPLPRIGKVVTLNLGLEKLPKEMQNSEQARRDCEHRAVIQTADDLGKSRRCLTQDTSSVIPSRSIAGAFLSHNVKLATRASASYSPESLTGRSARRE